MLKIFTMWRGRKGERRKNNKIQKLNEMISTTQSINLICFSSQKQP
jgi:hypothetical protein